MNNKEKNKGGEGCVFCKIVSGALPSNKVYEDDIVLAFLDIKPVNMGHTLIIPKKHFESIHDLPEEIGSHVMKIAKKISTALKEIGADGTNITINNGKDAGQIIFHFHIHIIPRFTGDNLPLWPVKDSRGEELEKIARKISIAL